MKLPALNSLVPMVDNSGIGPIERVMANNPRLVYFRKGNVDWVLSCAE